MEVSHVAGGGVGAIFGAVLAGLLNKYNVYTFSDVDAAVVGSAALSAGVGLGHAISKYGLAGLFKLVLHGTPKGTVIQP